MSKIDSGAVVWLTGASSGIGEAMAYALSERGVNLIISSRRTEELERVKATCANPARTEIIPLDLADSDSLLQKTKEAESKFGKIDILINNGGVSHRDTIAKTSMNVDRRLMEINYFGTIALSKAVLPAMLDRKSGHHVIISSVTGIISTPFRSAYAASKHALHGFYDAMRAECHADNVKVSLICPGFIKTNISINALKGDGSAQNKMDKAQETGMNPEKCALQIIRAIEKDSEEVYIGGFKEISGLYLKRFWPAAFSRVITKLAVT